jgi:hypothetical protein
MSFADVQAGYYNALLEGLGLSGETFQILQPNAPLIAGSNQFLWNFFNNIPPQSNTQNFIQSGGNQFFNDYTGVMAALKPGEQVNIPGDIGQQNYDAFHAYVQQNYQPVPPVNQLPDIFFNWAIFNAPDVADIGSSDYSTLLLDPISAGKEAAALYTNPPKAPDWALGYDTLVQQLAQGQSSSFSLSSETMNTDISQTWTGGDDSGFFGLWSGSNSTNTQSALFSENSFQVDASFAHVLQFQTNPGSWYYSSALGQAFANQGDPPWSPGLIQWANTFGPDGNMRFVLSSLLVVDTAQITVTSDAVFSAEDQQTIQNNSSAGLWPFYTSNSSGVSTTSAGFDQDNHITIHTATQPGVPMVLGANVLPMSQFLGVAVAFLERWWKVVHRL